MNSQFESDTLIDLDASGISKSQVYYSKDEIKISNVEVNHTLGRFQQSLSSLQFGSTSQIVIPNQDLISEVYLSVTLPNVVASQTLPQGWLFSLIKEISYTVGQSNVSNLRIDSYSLRQLCLMQCDTKEKATAVLKLAGEAINAVTTSPPTATVCIPLPWSNLSNSQKKPFDTSLLGNPIQIQIVLNDSGSIYGGSTVPPTSIVSASVFLRQASFTDRSNSLKNDLMSSNLMYQYPFQYVMSPSYKAVTIDGVNPQKIELLEFINSDLKGILFSVHRDDLSERNGANAPNPGASMECLNIELQYNGQTVYKAPGNSARLINMAHTGGVRGEITDNVQTQVTPWGSLPFESFIYYIPFSNMANITFEGDFDNTSRFSSQSMQLTITPQKVLTADSSLPGKVRFSYIYNSIIGIQNGVANIQFG